MPWIDAGEGWARKPKLGSRPNKTAVMGDTVETIDGWAEIDGRIMEECELDLREAAVIEIGASILRRCSIQARPETEIRIRGSELTDVDLSGRQLRVLNQTQLNGCKLAGTEITAACRHVEFHNCRLSLSRFLRAKVERTTFVDSTLDEVDFFESSLTDVSFAGSSLTKLNLDRVGFERVDFRQAVIVELENFQNLSGCLITQAQAHELAFVLAHSVGLGLEGD